MFCPFCAQPEYQRDGGGGSAVFVVFNCGNRIEIGEFDPWFRGHGSNRPTTCIVLENANPHNLQRRVAQLEEQLRERTSAASGFPRPTFREGVRA